MKDKHTWEHIPCFVIETFHHLYIHSWSEVFFVFVGILTMLVRLNAKGRIGIPSSLIWVYVCVVNAPLRTGGCIKVLVFLESQTIWPLFPDWAWTGFWAVGGQLCVFPRGCS